MGARGGSLGSEFGPRICRLLEGHRDVPAHATRREDVCDRHPEFVILAASAGKATAQFPAYGGGGMAVGYGGFGYGYPMMGYGYGMGGYGYPMMGLAMAWAAMAFPGWAMAWLATEWAAMAWVTEWAMAWLRNGRLWNGWLWHGLRNGRFGSATRESLRIRLSWVLWRRLHASDVRHRTYTAGHAELHDRDSALWTAMGTICGFVLRRFCRFSDRRRSPPAQPG